MPVWAWIVVVLAVLLGAAKLYDRNGKRHGHRPGFGEEPRVDLTHHQRNVDGGFTGGPTGGIGGG